jgi:toxin-antitoxin system PIN domain toxin
LLVPDVNVLLNVQLTTQAHHDRAVDWLRHGSEGDEEIGIANLVLSAVVRILTSTGVSPTPLAPADAFTFCDYVLKLRTTVAIQEGPRHWDIFRTLVLESGVSGPHVSDAYLAAFAIENNATFVTFDRGFRRFEGLKLQVLE